MDPLPSFGDLLSSLSLSEGADQSHSFPESSSGSTRSRSQSQSSLSSIVSSSLRTRTSSCSSNFPDEHLDSPPPDISSFTESSARSLNLAKSRSVGRLRGSRYAPYQDCSRRPSLPSLPNISMHTSPSKTVVKVYEARPQRAKHVRSRSGNTNLHPSSPISLYARRGHSRQSSSKSNSFLCVHAPQSPSFDPPKLPTVPSIQPFTDQPIPQRSPRIPLAPLSSPSPPRQMGLRISGFIASPTSTSTRYICA